jgi:FkbM family methyltransferase
MDKSQQTSPNKTSLKDSIDGLYPFKETSYGIYGDWQVMSQYLGFKSPPASIKGEWQHGHIEPERNTDPDLVIGSDGMSRLRMKSRFFVARDDQKAYLESSGYTDVHSIGLPILYVPKPKVSRWENSLLIMPFHTIGGMDVDRRKLEEEYMAYIDSILSKFDRVACCLHRNDYEHGDWKRHFSERGIETVIGGDPRDANSLLRMALVFSKFEFITGNSWGSHLAYGAYCGAKVSIAGAEHRLLRENFENLMYCKNKPRLLDLFVDGSIMERRKAAYPFLWGDPWRAEPQTEWAKWQLGDSCRRSPEEIRLLFQWPDRTQHMIRTGLIKAKSILRPHVAGLRRYLPRRQRKVIDPLDPVSIDALRRIGASFVEDKDEISIFAYEPGDFQLGLKIRANSSDALVYEQIIGKQEYRAVLSLIADNGYQPKWMIDCGANIGISSLYFRNRFPRCGIICVEADRRNYEQLHYNLQEQNHVQCYHRAVWSENNHLLSIDESFRDGLEWGRRVQEDSTSESSDQVSSVTIRDLIDIHEIDAVDFLRIDIEGAEQEIFHRGDPSSFLEKTRFLAIEIHDEVADRESIHNKMISSGFVIFRTGELTVGINRNLS